MTPRAARWLTRLYPSAWRARYGDEFRAFLDDREAGPRAIFDVIASALHEHICEFGGYKMSRLQHSLISILYAYLAALAAGINFYWTVDDTPLAAAMQTHVGLMSCWTMVEAGSAGALLAMIAGGVPVALAMVRFAHAARRRDIYVRLGFPVFAAALLAIWIAAVVIGTGGHWAPLPWAVAGDGPDWPARGLRWALASVTLALLWSALTASGISIKQAVQRSEFPEQRPLRLARVPALVLAGSIVLMTAGVAGWGVYAGRIAPVSFHSEPGLLNSTTFGSWIVSLALFTASAATAVRGARRLATQ